MRESDLRITTGKASGKLRVQAAGTGAKARVPLAEVREAVANQQQTAEPPPADEDEDDVAPLAAPAMQHADEVRLVSGEGADDPLVLDECGRALEDVEIAQNARGAEHDDVGGGRNDEHGRTRRIHDNEYHRDRRQHNNDRGVDDHASTAGSHAGTYGQLRQEHAPCPLPAVRGRLFAQQVRSGRQAGVRIAR